MSNKPGRPAKVTEEMVMDAMRKLRAAGRDVTIPAVREHIGDEGGNTTISDLIKVCEEKLRSEDAAMRKLTPSQEALAARLMRQVLSQLAEEIDEEAQRAINAAKDRETTEVAKAKRSEEAAWREVDQRVAERDQARGRVQELEIANGELQTRNARTEGRAEQQASEIVRLSAAVTEALAAQRDSAATIADLRARLEAKDSREGELQKQIDALRKGSSK